MKNKLLLLLGLFTLSSQAQLAVESFEGTWPPAGWSVYNVAGPVQTWQQSDPSSPMQPPYEGAYAAYLNRELNPSGGTIDYLVTPQFTVPANPQLRFMSRLTIEGDQNTVYKIMLLPPGEDPALLTSYILLEQFTELEINPVQMEYNQVAVSPPSLANYTGQQVRLAFVMEGDNGDRWLIDNVQMTSDCMAPINLLATNISMTTANLAWTSTGTETMWEIEVLPEDALPTGVGTIFTGTAPYAVSGLMSGSCYKFYVRSICGPNVISMWSGPFTFCTAGCSQVDQCPYSFNLMDAGGDGWNGGWMTVKQNNMIVAELTLQEGDGMMVSIPLCSDMPFEVEWVAQGTNPGEMMLTILNTYSQQVFTMPGGVTAEPNTVIYSGTANCTVIECWPPIGLSASVVNLDAILSWWGPQTNYEYYLVEEGDPAPTTETQGVAVTSTEVEVSNLAANTNYEYYVRLMCAGETTSAWAGPFSFSTGTGNSVSGTISLDINNDEVCDSNDVAIPSVEIAASLDGVALYSIYTNANGEYLIDNLPNGVATITLQPVAPEGYDMIDPISQTIDFSAVDNAEMSICVPYESIPSDISVIMIPVGIAQPGFNASYQVLVYNNNPVAVSNAEVTVQFDDVHVQFQNVSAPYLVDDNIVTFDTGVIAPYSSNMYEATFYVYPPQVNVGGEQLVYTATVTMTGTDDIPANNTHVLNQTTVNSYDPNDITVHEGPFIYEDQADDYLTYTIRFQNTGTANAVNIRLENTLDTQLDWDTFMPITSSHTYYVTRNNNQLIFEYPNIQLPDSTANEPASHGFVTYRIKPKATYGLGDIISNQAEIYFDFNPAIITNIATTEVIQETMGMGDFNATSVRLYPNPVYDRLSISASGKEISSLRIIDLNGREINVNYTQNSIDTSGLSSGMYLVKITTDTGSSTHRIIKQ